MVTSNELHNPLIALASILMMQIIIISEKNERQLSISINMRDNYIILPFKITNCN